MEEELILNFAEFLLAIQEDKLGDDDKISVSEPVTLNEDNFLEGTISFTNIVFEDYVQLTGIVVINNFEFKDCEFKKSLQIRSVSTEYRIKFINCKAQNISINQSDGIRSGINIENNSKIESFSMSNIKLDGCGLSITDSIIQKALNLTECTFESLDINSSEVQGRFSLNKFRADTTFKKTIFEDDTKFERLNCPTIKSIDSTYNGDFILAHSIVNTLSLKRDVFNGQFTIDNNGEGNSPIGSFEPKESKFIDGLNFNGLGKEIQNLDLSLSSKIEGSLIFTGLIINEAKVSGVNDKAKVIFKRTRLKHLNFIDFTNYGAVNFDDVSAENTLFKTEGNEDSSFIASNSDLGSMSLDEFNFKSFDTVQIINTRLSAIKASNVDWFTRKQLNVSSGSISKAQESRRKREVYRQIKHSLDSQGNHIESLEFKAREMQSYRNQLKASGKEYKWTDKVIMTVNWLNDYGRDWVRPTGLLILFTILTYTVSLPLFTKELWYNTSLPFADLCTIWNQFKGNLSTLANMFNPARKFATTYGDEATTTLYFIDILHRVGLGIFIFQIIRAFRRLAGK